MEQFLALFLMIHPVQHPGDADMAGAHRACAVHHDHAGDARGFGDRPGARRLCAQAKPVTLGPGFFQGGLAGGVEQRGPVFIVVNGGARVSARTRGARLPSAGRRAGAMGLARH